MLKKYKIFIITLASFFVFLILNQPVFALEVEYPAIPPFSVINPGTVTSADYVNYIFAFLIGIAGTIGIMSIVISGFKILMSFGKPEAISTARSNVLNAVLGIILLASSTLILTTINPKLVNIQNDVGTLKPGIYLRGPNSGNPDGFTYIPAPPELVNVDYVDLKELYYHCDAQSSDKNLLVWTYQQRFKEKDGNEATVSMKCGEILDISSLGSYETDYEDYGVYFYSTEDCDGNDGKPDATKKGPFSSSVHVEKGGIKFEGNNISSFRIVNGPRNDQRYGVILNKKNSLIEGECTEPIINKGVGSQCFKVPKFFPTQDNPSGISRPIYAYILKYNPYYSATVGSGVDLRSDNLFAGIKATGEGGINDLFIYQPYSSENHDANPAEDFPPDRIIRERGTLYTDEKDTGECCVKGDDSDECTSFFGLVTYASTESCLKDIIINGSYYVVLYSQNDNSGDRICQVFTNNYGNVKGSTGLSSGYKKLYKMAIIPRSP